MLQHSVHVIFLLFPNLSINYEDEIEKLINCGDNESDLTSDFEENTVFDDCMDNSDNILQQNK